MNKYDLIIIGAGPAGYTAAVEAAKIKKNVLIIEENEIGGSCVNYGCIPTKFLYQFAKSLNKLKKFSIKCENFYKSSLLNIIKQRDEVITKFRDGIKFLFKKYNVQLLKGKAILKKEGNEIYVCLNNEKFQSDFIIIATGSKPYIIEKFKNYLTPVDDFINFSDLPSEILIVGAGVIGCEMAFILANFGIKITLIEKENSVLPQMDKEISNYALKILKNNHIEIFLNTEISEIKKLQEKYIVKFNNDIELKFDKILFSAGRIPNSSFAKNIVKVTPDNFIIVNENYQTSHPKIFAIGDVINRKNMLANLAMEQAKDVVNYIFNKRPVKRQVIPYGVFISPEIAGAGYTENELKENKIEYKIKNFSLYGTPVSRIYNDKESFIKIITDSNSKILGVHIVSENAVELANLFAFIMNNSINELSVIKNSIFIHPSTIEIIKFIES